MNDINYFPLCSSCRRRGLMSFNFYCSGCLKLLCDKDVDKASIFAVMRQWNTSVQKNMRFFVELLLRNGASVNEIDPYTDMNIAMYVSRSGASCIGCGIESSKLLREIIDSGADIYHVSRWTGMGCIHIAALFDAHEVTEALLKASDKKLLNEPCSFAEGGTALHIACGAQSLNTCRVLVQNLANVNYRDNKNRTAFDCIGILLADKFIDSMKSLQITGLLQCLEFELTRNNYNGEKDLNEVSDILSSVKSSSYDNFSEDSNSMIANVGSQKIHHSPAFELNDKVIYENNVGVVRFVGSTKFASGIWYGIELKKPLGKNDGSVQGVRYFRCKPNHGVFVRQSRLTRGK